MKAKTNDLKSLDKNTLSALKELFSSVDDFDSLCKMLLNSSITIESENTDFKIIFESISELKDFKNEIDEYDIEK